MSKNLLPRQHRFDYANKWLHNVCLTENGLEAFVFSICHCSIVKKTPKLSFQSFTQRSVISRDVGRLRPCFNVCNSKTGHCMVRQELYLEVKVKRLPAVLTWSSKLTKAYKGRQTFSQGFFECLPGKLDSIRATS